MPISVYTEGRAEVTLVQTLVTGEGMVDVALRAGVKILPDRGMRLPSLSPMAASSSVAVIVCCTMIGKYEGCYPCPDKIASMSGGPFSDIGRSSTLSDKE